MKIKIGKFWLNIQYILIRKYCRLLRKHLHNSFTSDILTPLPLLCIPVIHSCVIIFMK